MKGRSEGRTNDNSQGWRISGDLRTAFSKFLNNVDIPIFDRLLDWIRMTTDPPGRRMFHPSSKIFLKMLIPPS
jgi:hypothetical protein